MIKLFGYEISFRYGREQWANEDVIHSREFIFRVERLTPREKQHRAEWKEMHPGKKYPTY